MRYVILLDCADDEDGMDFQFGKLSRLVWPLITHYTNISRDRWEVWGAVTHNNPTDSEFEEEKQLLFARLASPHYRDGVTILSMGSVGGRMLLGEKWRKYEVHNGMIYRPFGIKVIPVFPPQAALSFNSDNSKDPLAWFADGLRWVSSNRTPRFISPPKPELCSVIPDTVMHIGLDTEGIPAKPECITWATHGTRNYVSLDSVSTFAASLFRFIGRGGTVYYHNAPWDWQVLRAMLGHVPGGFYRDTMEKAYLLQTEPQSLKDLGARYFGLDMISWDDLVTPHWEAYVNREYNVYMAAHTVVTTASPKTGKPYKKPKIEYCTEAAKRLSKIKSAEKRAELLELAPKSLDHVPFDKVVEYSTLDAWVTLMLAKMWGMVPNGFTG